EKALGFDVYSEPLRKAAIIEALSTGLPVATEPVTLISTSPQADQLLIVQPVQSKQGRGVAGFVLSPKEFLANFTGAPSGEITSLSVNLLELRAGKPPLWLACARENFGETGKQPARKGLYSSTPVFAFGKTYEVLIVPEPHWLAEHPLNAGQNALFVGFILTLLLTTLVATLSNRPFILEQLVKRRTAELLRLSTAIEQSPEAVLITDSDGIIQYVNPAFETITGYSRNEAVGQTARILKSGHHDEVFYSDLWKTIAAGNIWRGRVVNKRKNGDFYTEEASISPVRDTDGTISGYVAVKRNITEELFKEEQFRQSQKMEAVGQLAGGIAHDFNNLLQAILGFSEILMTGMATGSAEHRNAEEIHKSAKRGAELIRQLLAFSRKQPVERKQINLNTELRDAEVLLQILLGSGVTYHFELADNLCPIYADHGQLTQIIMNLAVNARDAMPNGGRLTFATENITFDLQSIHTIPGAVQGSFVCLSVTDTGCGMSREVHDRLFEPFFTTKKVGQGTGLGLPVVYGIVKQSNGWIHVYSEEGHGSSFKIYLPVCGTNILSGSPEISAHNGRILLVEDDADIRNLVIRILELSGYELVAVSCAEDAIQVYEKEKGLFNMLFSDMILPGQTGIELADTLRIKNPALPVLLYSGYQDQRERWSNLDVKGYHFLKKPFSVTELLSAVNDTLNEAAQ
ncbi:MAG: PAS domain S-box protein, partial [Verrucomicrobia bacterium]|nr:PAS domain S-box protein [Verrucomicrobiota bacterium]